MRYSTFLQDLNRNLENTIATSGAGATLDLDEAFQTWTAMTQELRVANKKMFLVGNGASAMMASHMAADASKNGGFRAVAFNDAALMTAVSNDIAYEQSFAMPLQRFADSGDVLVTISSSGNSPNIIAAIKKARELGLRVITLSGMKPDNKSRQAGDLNFYVPAVTYGLTETAHQAVLHCWLDMFMEHYPET